MVEEIIEKFENFNKRGSGWRFKKILGLEIHLVKWKPLGGFSWLPLPDFLKNKNAIINIKNLDEKCFSMELFAGG